MISIRGLRKRFGDFTALDGVDLEIPAGSVHALLGPNGAGKTTTVRVVTTLLDPDEGDVEVAGHSVQHEAQDVRRSIGVSGQYAAVDEKLTGVENLTMVGQLYGMRRRDARARAHELLRDFRLDDLPAKKRAGEYSGGMRRRLDLAGAIVARPPVVILDEPTTGLDPRGRRDTWDAIQTLATAGTTVLLTTQYLEEADQLADAISVIDSGRIVAEGTAAELKARAGGAAIELVLESATDGPRALELVAKTSRDASIDDRGMRITAKAPGGSHDLSSVLAALESGGISTSEAALRQPTLDEVFLQITGQRPDEITDDSQAHDEREAVSA
ncbi:daunorubicin/doxorubicin resistance ABC transporter ATP-binding protein DrrA [Pseudoclavibacter sp. AY1F1]|uniref:ATP-binding cassette domain-containing protein n=1 Tax=Pseudoclavibacter sp. AY1F1 TaxID=2080583 RepID=UPI000CE79BDC|nr:ATP-binding cassette domain-containing protein [Pseudoclavibacter sp. AY1F1]PPF44188.1 daunorubicin/doxorubicin resistance ABC transporter ATP-binding protein DrrA [Pseudoclavibacter sp. AY1F1]